MKRIAEPQPLRLLLVIHNLATHGGAENQLEYLAKGLARLGHDVTLCCIDSAWRDLGPLEALGVRIVELRARTRIQRAAAVLRLARLARQAQVVHCTMWDASLWARLAAILARRPVLVADHTTDRSVQVTAKGAPRSSWIALHNRLLDRFTFATVICATSQARSLQGEGVAPTKIVHIPNGVPIAEITATAERGITRAQLGIAPDAKVVLQVGVFRPEKNQRGALESMARLRERIGGLVLVFAGDGPTREGVERLAKELNADWARFLGFRDDVPSLLRLADLMILPSISDTMPMTVIEAMAIGVPVVASEVGDVREMVGDGGICVPVGDADAFERACERVLSNDALREELSRAAQSNAAPFDALEMAERYSELFQRAAAGRLARWGDQGDPRWSA